MFERYFTVKILMIKILALFSYWHWKIYTEDNWEVADSARGNLTLYREYFFRVQFRGTLLTKFNLLILTLNQLKLNKKLVCQSSLTKNTLFHSLRCLSRNKLVDTGRKLKVHKTFRRRPGRLLKVLCTFNVCPVSTGNRPEVLQKKSSY